MGRRCLRLRSRGPSLLWCELRVAGRGPGGGPRRDGELVIVPITITAEGQAQSMPLLVVQEAGAWKISINRSLERLLS